MVVEQEGYGVREYFAQQPTSEVPEVACPHPLYGVTLGELAENGVYPVAKAAEECAPLGMRVSLLGGIRGQELYALTLQLLPGPRRMVVAIPNEQTGGVLGEFGNDREFVSVGRSH